MNAFEMQDFLTDALHFYNEDLEDEQQQIKSIRPFSEAHLLTTNKGLVVTLRDRSEFQITIVQSKLSELTE